MQSPTQLKQYPDTRDDIDPTANKRRPNDESNDDRRRLPTHRAEQAMLKLPLDAIRDILRRVYPRTVEQVIEKIQLLPNINDRIIQISGAPIELEEVWKQIAPTLDQALFRDTPSLTAHE